ncbi:hypothetical protein GMST_12860 [Geomonas silvestris]|uniref:Pentapeptide repeat-containing protein n=1 Tax=Geomonas silvestris TaxID=2740184 RepID=A0A6V8MG34_9BACT|nr:pentapeptide repeat-containing protein [Geomonas silvestris]GFO58961.1 hypothetical protein GMST_12860 [Geomonas silvestris]
MNRRYQIIILALTLALPVSGIAASEPPAPATVAAAAPERSEPSNEVQSRQLALAEAKLAALAAEGNGTAKPAEPKKQAAPKKKKAKTHKVKKKTDPAQARVYHRRLSENEVRGIMSTTRDLSGMDLSGMNLAGMDLSGAKLNRVNLRMTNLERADLAEADLELADLTGANLRGASLNQARLRGTHLEGSRMDGALWIDKTVCRSGSVGSCIE